MNRLLTLLLIFSTFSFSDDDRENDGYFDKGYSFLNESEYGKALEEFEKFIRAEKILPLPRMEKIAMMHRYKSSCLEQLQLFPLAISELQDAISIYKETGDQAKTAVCYEKMASMFGEQGKSGQAIYFLDEALDYYDSIQWLSHIQKACYELARIYYSKKDFLTARNYLSKALQVRQEAQVNFESTYLEPDIFLLLGKISLGENNLKLAGGFLDKADSICEVYLGTLPEKSITSLQIKLAKASYFRIAGLLKERESCIIQAELLCRIPALKFMRSFVMLEEAKYQESIGKTKASDDIISELKEYLNDSFKIHLDQDLGIYRDIIKGIIHHHDERFIKKGDILDLNSKLELLDVFIRQSGPTESDYSLINDYLVYGEENSTYYRQMVETAVQLFTMTGKQEFFERAFFYSELGYIEMMKTETSYSSPFQPDNSLSKELIRIAELKFQLNNSLGRIHSGGENVTKEKKNMVSVINEIERKQNRLRNINYKVLTEQDGIFNPKLLGLLQKNLSTDEVYLKYFDAGQNIYLFAVTSDTRELFIIPGTNQLIEEIKTFDGFVTDSLPYETDPESLHTLIRSGNRLYSKLLQPAEYLFHNRTLIIEGNGILNEMAYDALITDETPPATFSFQKLSFLIKKYNIRNSNSAGLFIKSCSQKLKGHRIIYAGFAPFQAVTNLTSLPGSGQEVRHGSRIFNGKSFTGKNVSKNKLFEMAASTGIIHLATHEKENNVYPQLSELVLSDDTTKTGNSQQLRFYEITGNQWKQQLIVLGACGSATGKYVANFGTLSLSNAFLVGGAKSVVAARWKVDDFCSGKIIARFFDYIRKGEEFSEALHKAKLEFLENSPEHFLHPQCWSVYSYTGCRQNLHSQVQFLTLEYLVPIVLLLFAGYIYYNRRNFHFKCRKSFDFFKNFQR